MKPALQKGQLTSWKDDRGFGFIRPEDESGDVFLHISALARAVRRPIVGDTIFYERTAGPDGRARASRASIAGLPAAPPPGRQEARPFRLFQTVIGVAVVAAVAVALPNLNKPARSPSPAALVPRPGCTIKGNVSVETGDRIYHVPGSRDYEKTVISAERGERWFCSEAEAVANGWRRSPW